MEVGAVFIVERYPQYTTIVIPPAQRTAEETEIIESDYHLFIQVLQLKTYECHEQERYYHEDDHYI